MLRKSNSDLLPEFVVIAGPNGAGKSTTSKNILEPFSIEAFDWDKQFHIKWESFDFDPTIIEGIRESVNEEFQNHINSAFSQKQSVAYETNFHLSHNLHLAKKARVLDYRNTLYFLALRNPKIGINRVADRVSRGGHNVSKSTIIERFEKGLGLLDKKAIEFYDSIFIYNSDETFILQLVIENKILVHKSKMVEKEIINKLPFLKHLYQLD